MRKTVKANINWISEKDGGRKDIIVGNNLMYCPIIRFDGIITANDWSSKITSSVLIDELKTEVELTFLVDAAPFELLETNQKFKLYEGAHLVAHGIIV